MATAQEVLAKLAALAGENEAVLGSNNTTVNKYFNAPGQPYCGYAIWYAVKKAGSDILDGCTNPAYVPTIKSYLASKGWTVANGSPKAGDIFAYKNDHVGFVYSPISGNTVITLEGNSTVYKTTACTGTSFEGIGYKKRTLDSNYTLYRPAYGGTSSSSSSTSSPASTAKVSKAVTVTMHELSQGDTGSEVKTLQRILYSYGITDNAGKEIEVDGDFGPSTEQATIKLQKKLFPNASSEWDGVMGAKSWTATLTELV